MGFNLKEKWEKADKKLIGIITSSIIGVILLSSFTSILSVKYYHYLMVQSFEKSRKPQASKQVSTKKPSDYKVGIPYEEAIKQDKPILALFYVDWCGYCRKFMPVFEKIAKTYHKDLVFSKINVEDPKNDALVKKMDIKGFPTVYLMDNKSGESVLLSNAYIYDLKTVRPLIDEFLKSKKK